MKEIDLSSIDVRSMAERFISLRQIGLELKNAPRVSLLRRGDKRGLLELTFLVGLRPSMAIQIFGEIEPGALVNDSRSSRLDCGFCGRDTLDAFDYLEISISSPGSVFNRLIGAHAACLSDVLIDGAEYLQISDQGREDVEDSGVNDGNYPINHFNVELAHSLAPRVAAVRGIELRDPQSLEIASINSAANSTIVVMRATYVFDSAEFASIDAKPG